MTKMLILKEQELRDCITLNGEALSAVEEAFISLASGHVVMPPILRLDVHDHNGEIDVKTAYIPGLDSFAVKMSPGFFNNPGLGLPSTNGLMVLFSAHTGLVESVLLDNGYLTDVRTALAGAIAAKYLARESVETVGVIGAGSQARYQIEALKLVRDFTRVLVWGRDKQKAQACAVELAASVGVEVIVSETPKDVVEQSMIVVTSTPATEPLIDVDWMHPGLHITAMGSDAEHKNELDPRIISNCDAFICDTRAQSSKLGELHHAIENEVVAPDFPAIELGRVITGETVGRSSRDDVTVCDLTGTGAQDTAIARLAYQKAVSVNSGTAFES